MTDAAPPATRPVRRYRVLGVVTLAVVVAWVWGGWWVYQKYMVQLQFARAIGFVMSQGMGGAARQEGGVDPAVEMKRVTEVTEIVRNSWGVLMALAAIVMLLAGVVALVRPRRGRGWLLGAGLSIILATIGTMIGILVLIRMADFPPMKPAAYVVITGGQSFMGWVLVFACRKGRSRGVSERDPIINT